MVACFEVQEEVHGHLVFLSLGWWNTSVVQSQNIPPSLPLSPPIFLARSLSVSLPQHHIKELWSQEDILPSFEFLS